MLHPIRTDDQHTIIHNKIFHVISHFELLRKLPAPLSNSQTVSLYTGNRNSREFYWFKSFTYSEKNTISKNGANYLYFYNMFRSLVGHHKVGVQYR